MKRRSDARAAAVFLAPYGVLFVVFVLAPLLYGFWISLHNWHVLGKSTPFVGFKNYSVAISDDLFRIALARTAWFVFLTVPLGNLVSLLLAVGLNQKFLGTTLYKVAFYLPVVMSISVTAILWRWLYSSEFGIINYYLGAMRSGLGSVGKIVPDGLPWLSSPTWAMPSIALMSIWWGAGGSMLVYLAALKAVPKELLEAAELDGSVGVKRFWAVTWPAIRPAALFCIVMSVIASSQVFGQTYILTGGGPAYSTLTVVLYMYQQGFGQYQLGYASAVAYLLFLVVFAFTAVQFKLMASSLRPS